MSTGTSVRNYEDTAVLVTRQAMFDRNTNVFGYELLSAVPPNPATYVEQRAALAPQLLRVAARVGLEPVVGTRPAFIKVTEAFLRSGRHHDFPAGRVCFMFDANDFAAPSADRDGLESLFQDVRRDGYRVGLSSVNRTSYPSESVPQIDFITIDLEKVDESTACLMADEARRVGVLACATHVETPDQLAGLNDRFDLYQGYFYQRRSGGGKGISTGRLATLQLLTECANPEATLEAFESIIGRDPSLTFRVMQLANSGFSGLPRRLNSLREALVTVGVTNIRNLAMIASLNRIEDQQPELLFNSLVRAKVCELLARSSGLGPAIAFTAGLLSMLDAFLGVSLEEATEKAALNDELRAAIVEHHGPLGAFVAVAIAFEHATYVPDPDSVIDGPALAQAFLTAVAWAQEVTQMAP